MDYALELPLIDYPTPFPSSPLFGLCPISPPFFVLSHCPLLSLTPDLAGTIGTPLASLLGPDISQAPVAPLFTALLHPHPHVRAALARCLRAITMAVPGRASALAQVVKLSEGRAPL